MQHSTLGHPCWIELVTADRDKAVAFYGGLFGWTTTEPAEEFGGYSQFLLDGRPVSGLMPQIPELTGDPGWSVSLATPDAEDTAARTVAAGGTIVVPPMELPGLGTMLFVTDASGMGHGAWQAGPFTGIDTADRPGEPIWFEAYSKDFGTTSNFLRDVFDWTPELQGDTDEFRYATNSASDSAKAGLMDASGWGDDFQPAWTAYIKVDDMDATIARVLELGGAITQGPDDTPYGVLTEIADPAGQRLKVMVTPQG